MANNGYKGYPAGESFEENMPAMPGHHETVDTPNYCLCCGKEYWWIENGPTCICRYMPRWFQDELHQVACEVHVVDKVKDGIFGAYSANFDSPIGNPAYKPARSGRVAPIVHGKPKTLRPTR